MVKKNIKSYTRPRRSNEEPEDEEPEDEEPEIMKTIKKLYNRKKGKEMVDEDDDDPKETDEEPIQSEGKK
ncbi:hypothetical protein Tco_1488018, partial [Tanacetum coccineum]